MYDLLLKNKLVQVVDRQVRERKPCTLSEASTISIVFDATDNNYRQDVLKWARSQEKEGKKVTLLGYFNTRRPPENPGFLFFSKRGRALDGTWKSADLSKFFSEHPQLLICLNPDDTLPLAYVAARAQSGMKVGRPSKHPQDFDLTLETPEDKGLSFFFEQLHHYLDKLHTAK